MNQKQFKNNYNRKGIVNTHLPGVLIIIARCGDLMLSINKCIVHPQTKTT